MLKNVIENYKINNKDTFKKTVAVGTDSESKICYAFKKLLLEIEYQTKCIA